MNTFFYKKDRSVSSMRTTNGEGENKITFNSYFGENRGGVTFKSKNYISRMNKKGECIGVGIKTGKYITYIGSNGEVSNHIPEFR